MPTVSGFVITLADRVRETTSTTGTGTYSLNGAVSGFRTFVAGVGNGVRCIYVASLAPSWEVGIGTVTSGAPATVSRDSILASSNSNNAVSWGAGTKDIFCDAGAALLNEIYETPVINNKITTFTNSGTFTTDAKCLYANIRIVGGGGGGGGTNATGASEHASGAGGGGGEYAEGKFTAAQLGASKTVTIGAGGTGVNNGTGNTGGTTSVGTLITAIGGSGGAVGGATTTDTQSSGGTGGTGGTGGHLRIQGSRGGQGMVRAGRWLTTGVGGSSVLGSSNTGDQNAGFLYGGGGCGAVAAQNTGSRSGASGAAGVVIVEELLKP